MEVEANIEGRAVYILSSANLYRAIYRKQH
jgi:hypothetical protein